MDLHEALEKRRTIRVYREKATEEQLRRLLVAASKAPSGGNRQSWEFILVDDQEIAGQLAEIKYRLNRQLPPPHGETQKDVDTRALLQKKSFDNAAIVAVCCTSGQVADGWLSVENISLAALAEGLGTGIVGYWGAMKKEAEVLLGLPDNYELVCVLKIGVPGEEPAPRKLRPEFSWLHRNKF
jgi:nitroreductase